MITDAQQAENIVRAWVRRYKLRRNWRAWWRIARILRTKDIYRTVPNCDAADEAFRQAKHTNFWWCLAAHALASRESGDPLERPLFLRAMLRNTRAK